MQSYLCSCRHFARTNLHCCYFGNQEQGHQQGTRASVQEKEDNNNKQKQKHVKVEGVHKKSDFFPLRKKGANSG